MKTPKVIHIHLQQEQTGEYVTFVQGMDKRYAHKLLVIINQYTNCGGGRIMIHPELGIFIRLLGNCMEIVKSEIVNRKLVPTVKVHDHRISF